MVSWKAWKQETLATVGLCSSAPLPKNSRLATEQYAASTSVLHQMVSRERTFSVPALLVGRHRGPHRHTHTHTPHTHAHTYTHTHTRTRARATKTLTQGLLSLRGAVTTDFLIPLQPPEFTHIVCFLVSSPYRDKTANLQPLGSPPVLRKLHMSGMRSGGATYDAHHLQFLYYKRFAGYS